MVEITPATQNILKVAEVLEEPPQIDQSKDWRMYVNRAKNSLGKGAGVVLKNPEGAVFKHYLRLNFLVINNEAKYEAFITGLRSTKKLLFIELHIISDSKLVVNQVTKKFEARGAKIEKYLVVGLSSGNFKL